MKTKRLHSILLLFLAISALTVLSCSKEKLVEEDGISTQPNEEQADEPGNPEDEPDEPWDECGYQEEGDPFGGNLVELNFTAEAPTKTTIDVDKHVYWVAGDKVRFDGSYIEGGDTLTVNYKTSAKSTGTTTAFEAVNVKDDIRDYLYVTYPDSAATHHSAKIKNNGTPRMRIWFRANPGSGTFGAADLSLAKTTRSAGVWNTTLSFKNVAAILKIGITDPDINKIVVSSEGGEYIAGELEYRITPGGALQDKGSLEDNAKRSSSITLNVDGVGDYYIAAVPCTLSTGFRVTPYKDEVAQTPFCYMGEYVLQRGKITKLGSVDTHAGQYYVSVSGAGNKTGQNFANAMDKTQFKNLVAKKSTSADAAEQAALISGATFHFAADTYDLGEMVELGFLGQTSSVPVLHFEGTATAGGDTTVFTGNSEHRIFEIAKPDEAGVYTPINLSINNCKFINGTGGTRGGQAGAIRLQEPYSTLNLTNCQFRGNSNTSGDAGALMLGSGTSSVTNCSFSNNSASNNGSAISFTGTGDISLSNCEIKYNSYAPLRFVNLSSFSASGLTFKGNSGSCIRVQEDNDMDLEFTDCTFLNNTDGGGAVLYNRGGSTVTFNGTTQMTNCHSTTTGGAIVMRRVGENTEYTTAGNLTITGNCTIDGCYVDEEETMSPSSRTTSGSVMYLNTTGTVSIGETGSVTIQNCYNDSNKGGVAIVGAGDFTFANTTFDDNRGTGAAIHVNNTGATVTLEDCIIKNNETNAIYGENVKEFTLTNVEFKDNYAQAESGAAGWFENSGTYTFTDCDFIGNHCDYRGGAVVFWGVEASITGGKFQGNHADGSGNDYAGGAIYVGASGGGVECTDVLFKQNYSFVGSNTNAGGIIRLLSSGNYAHFNNCVFDDNWSCRNTQSNNGCAAIINCRNGGTIFYFNACEFKNNSSGRGYSAGNQQGGNKGQVISTYASSTICMNNCSIHDNFCSRNSDDTPWLYFDNASNKFIMSNCTVIGDRIRRPEDSDILKAKTGVIRLQTDGTYAFINNIICSNYSDGKSVGCGTTVNVPAYYCKVSPGLDSDTNWTNTTGFGDDYWASSSCFGSWSSPWTWNGTMTGTNSGMKAATADVNSEIEDADSDFYTWLNSIGALGKDINGRSRGATSWPGCYQN